MTIKTATVLAPAALSRPRYVAALSICLGLLALTCAALWLAGGRTYFVKSLTESHNIILAAANIRDVLTFLVQDLAASPEPIAHPFWYIHHPNFLAKIISFGLGGLGFGLEGQVGIMLALNVAGLIVVAAAFSRFSPAAALAAVVVAATSYESFHYSAGDLCRGPLYLLLWPFLYALIHNTTLSDRRMNLTIGVVAALSVLSDWGFALFVVTFAFCWASLGHGRPPWRWYFLMVALPTAIAFGIYEAAVIAAVGWDFFLFDAKLTYFGRLGVGDFVDYLKVVDRFREHSVIVQPAQGQGTTSVAEVLTALVIKPMLNTGPVWMLSLPVLVLAATTVFRKIGWGLAAWGIIAILVGLNLVRILPMPVLLPAAIAIAIGLARVHVGTDTERICGWAAALVLAILVPAIVFPGFTVGFSIGGGRPPFPLLEMSGAALFAHVAASGQFERWLTSWSSEANPFRRISSPAAYGGWAFVAVIIAAAVVTGASSDSLLGVSKGLAIGVLIAMAGGPIILLIEAKAFIRARSELAEPSEAVFGGVRAFRRWWLPLFLVAVTLVLASHVSDNASLLGRYSTKYAIFLAALTLVTLTAVVLAAFPAAMKTVINAAAHPLISFGGGGPLTGSPSAQITRAMVAIIFVSQIGWFGLAVAGHPPQPIPYAAVLSQPEYRGKSFLTTSYEGIAWYSTRGWTYMSPNNPPQLRPISSRFRHFANWRDEAKYGHPDYFLCDNGPFSFVAPGVTVSGSAPAQSCQRCTCKDIADILRASGHDVVVDRPDFAIVKFNWKTQ